jgi:hypothetical protein
MEAAKRRIGGIFKRTRQEQQNRKKSKEIHSIHNKLGWNCKHKDPSINSLILMLYKNCSYSKTT